MECSFCNFNLEYDGPYIYCSVRCQDQHTKQILIMTTQPVTWLCAICRHRNPFDFNETWDGTIELLCDNCGDRSDTVKPHVTRPQKKIINGKEFQIINTLG